MRVIVVGAGIGGLAVAVGLRQAGVDVQILERAERVRSWLRTIVVPQRISCT